MRPRPSSIGAFFAVLLVVAPNVDAQQLTGRVTDQQTGSPLAAVQVFIAGSGLGALTQQNGRYLLLNVPAGTHTLTAERIGYRSVTQQVTVGAGETVVQDFALSEEALGLDEIIVTGTPGGTQRRAIGNAVTSVQAADVTETLAVAGAQDLLSGRSPGVQLTRTSGNVGTGSAIEIRAVGSFSLSSDPLIYVDGIRVNNDSQSGPQLSHRTGEVNPLNDINPLDIESIEIIKGPAAATLYGTEASAGVIQIITKRGVQGAPQFDLSASVGANYMRDPAKRIGEFWSCSSGFTALCREGSAELFSYNMYDEANKMVAEGLFPWPTQNLFRNGPTQNYNLDVRGGTENVRYFVSANYGDNQGIVTYNWEETFRIRANLGLVFSENFSFDLSTGYVDGEARFMTPAAGDGDIWTDMVWSNGYCATNHRPDPSCSRLKGFQEHLPSDVAKLDVRRAYNRFTGSGTFNFTYGDWFTSRAIVGIDRGQDENTELWLLETELSPVYEETAVGEVTVARPITTNVSVDVSSTVRFDLTESLGTATSAGVQYYMKELSDFGLKGVGFAHPASRTVNQTPASNATIRFDFVQNKSLGFYVQEELSWNDRLFLTGAVRFDDNSAFGSDFEAVTYPKLAATWVISEESFWNLDLINSFRLRGAWGVAGRQPDAFAGAFQYGVISGAAGGTALAPLSPGNTEVGPEKSTELELGFDVALLDDRIAGEFTWFNEKNEDALLGIALPPSQGFPGSVDQNVGQLDNWGWEASLGARIYESPAFSFRLNLTASHVDNEIKELGEFPGTNFIKLGYPYPNYTENFRTVSAQFDPNGTIVNGWGEPISSQCDKGVALGDGPKYGIVPGGPTVPCQDASGQRIYYGRAFATYTFSVNPQISLFNNSLTIHALADAQYGRVARDGQAGWGCFWQNCKPMRTHEDPLFFATLRRSWGQTAMFDADYWKLREIGVRYALPESLVARIGAERASLAVSGRELGIIWRAQDTLMGGINAQDPEFGRSDNRQATAWWSAPPTSSMTATLRVSF